LDNLPPLGQCGRCCCQIGWRLLLEVEDFSSIALKYGSAAEL
jgi:Fe-S-cluster containining protein